MCAFTVYDEANDEPAAVPEGETGNVRLVKKSFIDIVKNRLTPERPLKKAFYSHHEAYKYLFKSLRTQNGLKSIIISACLSFVVSAAI